MMKLAAQGVSRQEAHEEIRVLSHEAGSVVKNEVRCPPADRLDMNYVVRLRRGQSSHFLCRASRTTWSSASGRTSSSSPSGTTWTACWTRVCTSVAVWRSLRSTAAQEALLRRRLLLMQSTSRVLPLLSSTSKRSQGIGHAVRGRHT